MKLKTLSLIAIILTILASCSSQKTINLPLSPKNGYGYFNSALSGIAPYSNSENDPWKKTHLSVPGAPKNWTEIKYSDIETNIYQSIYQNYLLGNISKAFYEDLQKSLDWKQDTLQLSKEPLKTKIALAFGKDSTGVMHIIVDANNNLDFSDDKSFVPYNLTPREKNNDSVALSHTIQVSFEKMVNHKKQLVTAPLFIGYMPQYNMFFYNFPQYYVANFKGNKIAVCSDGFMDLSYQNPDIVLVTDSLKKGDKISNDKLIEKNEYIEIKGKIYKNTGVNLNMNTLSLEKISLPKNKLYSTQVGYKAYEFQGKDFISGTQLSSGHLKGKYVLLDFWAVWCAPCVRGMPNLKELYKKTDRNKFEIIGVVGDSSPDRLKKVIEKNEITWPQMLSTNTNKIKETFGIRGYPTTFLINPEGIIVAKNLVGKKLEEKILKLLTNKDR